MSIEELEIIAEALKGLQVIVEMKSGDKFPGILTSLRTNAKTLKKAIELTDENGKGALIPFELINDIVKVDQD